VNSQKNPSAGTGADRFSEEYRNVMTARRALAAPGRHDGRYIPADRVLAPEWVLSIEPGVVADRAVDLSTPSGIDVSLSYLARRS
jgi:hypothetical protein